MKNTDKTEILYNNIVIEKKENEPERSMMREHYHDFYELYFFLGDRMRYFVSGTAYDVRRGGLVFVDKFTYHRTTYREANKERVVLFFRDELFDAFSDKAPILAALAALSENVMLNFDAGATARIEELTLRLIEEYERGEGMMTVLLFAELLLTIARYIASPALLPSKAEGGENAVRVAEVIAYINTHYGEKVSLSSLSDLVFVDKFYFCHIFKRITGMTVVEFINGKRLNEAKRLLLTTDRRVGDIAAAVGFANQNHFNTLFRQTYGKTPTEFRSERKSL
ncbi:MAG: helix-turn-helix domain-containing protein [Clostridia bacterium]|nr:helix-turn-helix domain-containing protein [Clostridia bacterium]